MLLFDYVIRLVRIVMLFNYVIGLIRIVLLFSYVISLVIIWLSFNYVIGPVRIILSFNLFYGLYINYKKKFVKWWLSGLFRSMRCYIVTICLILKRNKVEMLLLIESWFVVFVFLTGLAWPWRAHWTIY